jgi:hypothetical protein
MKASIVLPLLIFISPRLPMPSVRMLLDAARNWGHILQHQQHVEQRSLRAEFACVRDERPAMYLAPSRPLISHAVALLRMCQGQNFE